MFFNHEKQGGLNANEEFCPNRWVNYVHYGDNFLHPCNECHRRATTINGEYKLWNVFRYFSNEYF